MLTLERGRGWSIYSLGGEEVHGLRPFTVRRQAEPDVRGFGRGRMSGLGGRMSGRMAKASVGSGAWAGFPGFWPDVQTGRQMSRPCRLGRLGFGCCGRSRGQMSGALAGCPGPGRCSWLLPLVLLIRGLGDLYIFMRIFGRALLVPNHAQHLELR